MVGRYSQGLLGRLKGALWAVGGVLPEVPRTSHASCKAAGVVGPRIEPRGEGAIRGMRLATCPQQNNVSSHSLESSAAKSTSARGGA